MKSSYSSAFLLIFDHQISTTAMSKPHAKKGCLNVGWVQVSKDTLRNRSLETRKVPEIWKCANIVPIYKKGNKDEVSNYRPVSLTCIICKILESIIRDSIMEHFAANKLFTNRQFGFLKGRSTVTQLLQILDEWTEALETGGRIDVI